MNVLKKFKGKTVSDYYNYAYNAFFGLINRIWFKLLCVKPIDEKLIVLESNDDCCDNAYAFFDYLRSTGISDEYCIVWLVDHKENFHDTSRVKYVRKRPHPLYDSDTINALVTCKWYIFDHVNAFAILNKREQQKVVYLCHGYAGFKAKKGYNKLKVDLIVTTGEVPLQGCNDFFGNQIPKAVLGFSRLDYFYTNKKYDFAKELCNIGYYKKNLIWLPTFRKSDIKSISEDYLNNTETGLPLLETEEDFLRFNSFLAKESIQVIIKIHPLQSGFDFFKKKFSNIKIIGNQYLFENEIQLYQIIPVFDALITDYSSVSTDYLLLDKPIVYILDDIEEYKKTRGLYPEDPLVYMPGDHVYSYEQLKSAIIRIARNDDQYSKEREDLVSLFHKYQDGHSSKRIAKYLGIERGSNNTHGNSSYFTQN